MNKKKSVTISDIAKRVNMTTITVSRALSKPDLVKPATLENGIQNRSWLCGPAEEFITYLKEIEQKSPGLEHVMIGWALGTPRELMIEQLTRFAREVMPAFRR